MKMSSLLACFLASSSKKPPVRVLESIHSTLRRSWFPTGVVVPPTLLPQHLTTRAVSSTTTTTSQLWLLPGSHTLSPSSWSLPRNSRPSTTALSFAPITTRAKVDKFIKTSIASTEKIPLIRRKPQRLRAEEGEEIEAPKRFRGPRRNKKETKLIVVDSNVKKLRKLRDGGVYRADRVLANRGWGSRSECFQLLMKKQVSILEDADTMSSKHKKKGAAKLTVDEDQQPLDPEDPSFRRVVQGPMERVALNAKLFVRGQPVPEIPLLMAYHKPKWMLSTMSDPQHPEPATAGDDFEFKKPVKVEEEEEEEDEEDQDPSGEYDESGDWEDVEEKDDEDTSIADTSFAEIDTTDSTDTTTSTEITAAGSATTATVSTATTRGGRPNLGQVLPPVYQRQKLHPVGRLDYDSSGLILFSSLGTLTQKLLHPSHYVEKEYRATVSGKPNLLALERQLAEGVSTADGVYTARLVSVNPVPADEVPERLQHIINTLPPEYDRQQLEEKGYLREVKTATQLSHVRLVVTEGKHRMVRRMLANIGFPVLELKRLRHGQVALGDLPEGQFRFLTQEEQDWAEELLYKQWMKPQRGNLTTTTVPRKPRPRKTAANATTTSSSSTGSRSTTSRERSSADSRDSKFSDARDSRTARDSKFSDTRDSRTFSSSGSRTITANKTATNKRFKTSTGTNSKSSATRAPRSKAKSTSKGKRY